jgi:uracil-DNA glycosylase
VIDAPALSEWCPSAWPVAEDWRDVVDAFLRKPEALQLAEFVKQRIATGAILYPAQPLLALALTPLSEVKVVIIGQDPYHGPGQAQGLAFSVAPGLRVPPSLRNIYKELQRDLGLAPASNGCLMRWARQGVLLLNTCLSVEDAQPGCHAGRGWEVLTDEIVRTVERQHEQVVFLLWGAHAQKKCALLEKSAAGGRVLSANHPSPLSATRGPAPFIGCGHFGRANNLLQRWGRGGIEW